MSKIDLSDGHLVIIETKTTRYAVYRNERFAKLHRIPHNGLVLEYLPVSPTSLGILERFMKDEARRRKCPYKGVLKYPCHD